MKKTMLILLMSVITLAAMAQEEKRGREIETLFDKGDGLGFYGAFSMGYTSLDAKDAFTAGGRGGIILGRMLAIGISGTGFVNDIKYHQIVEGNPLAYSLAGGYGGIFIEPVIGYKKPVHVSFPILFGGGGLAIIESQGWHGWEPWDPQKQDGFMLVEPSVEVEFNFTRYLRVAAFASHRFTTKIDMIATSPTVLNTATVGLTVKLGMF